MKIKVRKVKSEDLNIEIPDRCPICGRQPKVFEHATDPTYPYIRVACWCGGIDMYIDMREDGVEYDQ